MCIVQCAMNITAKFMKYFVLTFPVENPDTWPYLSFCHSDASSQKKTSLIKGMQRKKTKNQILRSYPIWKISGKNLSCSSPSPPPQLLPNMLK